MDTCLHCGKPASAKVNIYWDCELPACDQCYERFEQVRTALESKMAAIFHLSRGGQHEDALRFLHRITDPNRPFDDFGWLRRNELRMEASIYEDAGQYGTAIEKLKQLRDLGSPNLSAFVQDQIAIANNLAHINRVDDAWRELERALHVSTKPERGHPSPLDVLAVLVHSARISQRLGTDIPALHSGLFIQIAQKLGIPPAAWQTETSLASRILKADKWLEEQDRRAIAGSTDRLLRPGADFPSGGNH